MSECVHTKEQEQEQEKEQEQEQEGKEKPLGPLYLARALAAWGDRTWQFLGGMFLLRLGANHTQDIGDA